MPPPVPPPAPPDPVPLVPPDEKFWQRYSPHHEFPLSSVTSFTLHFLVIAFLALAVVFAPRLGCLMSKENPLPLDAVQLNSGGGGDPRGTGPGRGDTPEGRQQEDITKPAETPDLKPETLSKINVPTKDFDPVTLPNMKDTDGAQAIAASSRAIQQLSSLSQDARSKIFNGLKGKGDVGPGSGGGKDKGADKGKGPGAGEGTAGKLSQRQARVLRWTMVFDTLNGADYAKQLQALGAILAVPSPKDSHQYLLIEDLSRRPVEGKVKDLAEIQRIYWIDDRPESVGPLANALGLRPVPHHVVAFFPVELEQKLLKLELNYRNKGESEIRETKFRIVRAGTSYEPRVESQR